MNPSQGRGSNNPNTGPQRDHASFATNRVTGAFAFIDAGHPRRPGDKALLMSEEFPSTAEVSCQDHVMMMMIDDLLC